jgi:hypothetical protein
MASGFEVQMKVVDEDQPDAAGYYRRQALEARLGSVG